MTMQPGFILFVVGLITTIVGAAKVPAELGGWPDTVGLFGFGTALTTLGLVLWHRARRAAAAAEGEATSAAGDPVALLIAAQEPLARLGADIENLDADGITEREDEVAYVSPE